ncbi:Deoxycytidine triphosphate deaminase [mine drainage metagenome]|uniref:Deoxycytidine triphosphate deaminase n=1 Tax=mine drainage metagenome TaxID=410659 RepID=T1BTR3_9ZZZZ
MHYITGVTMILSDSDLYNVIREKRLVLKPFSKEMIRENGIDFRLSNEIVRHKNMPPDFIYDPSDEKSIRDAFTSSKKTGRMVLEPKEQVLLSTYEHLSMPDDIVAFVELRSTWARNGLSMPPTIIDAGFKGTITLEVINNAPFRMLLRPKYPFAHIIFMKATNRIKNPYSGTYFEQRGVKLPKPVK